MPEILKVIFQCLGALGVRRAKAMAACSLAALIIERYATVIESIIHPILHSHLAIMPEVFYLILNNLRTVCPRWTKPVAAGFLAAFVIKRYPAVVQAIIHAVLNSDLAVVPEICQVLRQVTWAIRRCLCDCSDGCGGSDGRQSGCH